MAKLVLIHGFLSGPAVWQPLIRHLAGTVEIVAPYLPGYGRLERDIEHAEFRLERLADSVEQVLERERPTHVLGHSMGAIVALELARRHPGRFERVGVAGLPVYASREEALAFLHRRGLFHRGVLHSDRVTHWGCRVLYVTRWAWTPLLPWVEPGAPRSHVVTAFDHSAAAHAAALNEVVFAGLVPGIAAGVTTPVAALHGDRDRAAPLAPTQELAAARGWDFAIAPNSNHQFVVYRPRLTARWVRSRVLAKNV